MIPTPDLSHLTKEDYEKVYEPADESHVGLTEDTFILLDALEEDTQELLELKPRICLEIGPGSGCVSAFVGTILGPSSALYLTTDINTHASLCTKRTGAQNKIPLESITASLVGPLLPRLFHAIDLLIFNPPYVPTLEPEASEAQDDRGISGAWAGGTDGMQVTDLLLGQLEDLLSSHGRFYLVAVKQNKVSEIQRKMKSEYNLQSTVVLQRRAGREHLYVVKFWR